MCLSVIMVNAFSVTYFDSLNSELKLMISLAISSSRALS